MRKLALSLVVLFAGCCAYPGAAYVESDETQYEYAQPKLVEWAEAKGGDWPNIVKNNGISWKSKIERAKKKGKEDSGE